MTPELSDCDFLIVGGGVIGVAIAKSLAERNPDARITILEKESEIAFHSSGRNSGVLHAGFYYSDDSLKAKFTKEGCLRLTEYCLQKSIPIKKCGKLVVAQSPADLPQIDELLRRAKKNSVELFEITKKEAYEIEPNVRFHERVLWSPRTSVVNPKQVVSHLAKDIQKRGVQILFNTAYLRQKSSTEIETNRGPVRFRYFVNCAGLYADKIALDFGFSKQYRLLPFKGLYLKCKKPLSDFLRTNIYPVPNLKNPFLGVHFTLTTDDLIKIGPTAIPALWREQYQGLDRFSFSEMLEIAHREMGLLFNANFDFKSLAFEEIKKYRRSYLLSQASKLVQHLDESQFQYWGPAGIRAQLLNIETKKLEMDYVFQGDTNSFHVLNAVSPAFTCSLPFSEFLCDKISQLRGI